MTLTNTSRKTASLTRPRVRYERILVICEYNVRDTFSGEVYSRARARAFSEHQLCRSAPR